MPTYEYECQSCKERFDIFQKMTAELLKKCPKCKGALKRLIGNGAGIIFKGSGFYATDHRSPEYKEKAKKESSLNCKSCNTSSSCNDSKAKSDKKA